MKKMNQKKIVITLIALLVIVLIIIFTLIVRGAIKGSGVLNIKVIPKDTSYNINGKSYRGDLAELTLPQGEYSITFTRDLFVPLEKRVKINKNQNINLDILLKVTDEANNDYYNLTQDQKNAIDESDQMSNEKEVQNLINTNPIVNSLPHIEENFRIDYGFYNSNNPNEITIEITILKTNISSVEKASIKKEALEWLKNQGTDPEKLILKWS